jgi:hypothetical protein
MTESRDQMAHLYVQSTGLTIRAEDPDLPSVFCHLSSVFWTLIPNKPWMMDRLLQFDFGFWIDTAK